MKINTNSLPWLELTERPAFCVKGGVVVEANTAARNRMLHVGTHIDEIVTDHRNAYDSFESGKLYLTVTVGGLPCSASVTRTKECDLFIIEQSADDDQLQVLALAAQQLRIPLANVMTVTDHLFADISGENPDTQRQANQINHNLFQLLRIISNMSDAGSFRSCSMYGMQTVEITGLFDEVIEKVQSISCNAGITLSYTGIASPIFGLANPEKLERAIYNLLSNALKFSPVGSTVEAKLVKHDALLHFIVCNTNAEDTVQQSFWSRYRREPAIEGSQYGLGLGMTLISGVAASHGGTVLVDHPSQQETRITMTIAIKKDDSGAVRSPIMRIGDYAGGRDKALLEFAEILPADSYENIN